MRGAIGQFKSRDWAILAAATILPGVLTAGIEFLATNGVTGLIPLGAAIAGGILALLVLMYIAARNPDRSTPSMETSRGPEIPNSSLATSAPEIPNSSLATCSTSAPEIPNSSLPTSAPEIPSRLGVPNTVGRTIGCKFFSPRKPDELVHEVQGLTEIAAREASQRHIGHWLSVDGHIIDVFDISISRSVVLLIRLVDSKTVISMAFDETIWRTRLLGFNIGDHVAGIGRIARISSSVEGRVDLEECELSEY